jgi:hypothetical protein
MTEQAIRTWSCGEQVFVTTSHRQNTLAVSREFLFLLVVCFLDTLSSAYLFQHGMAREANPLLLPFAEAGMLPFVTAKMSTFIPALAVAEWYSRRRPEFVLPLLRWAGALYVGIYAILVAGQFLG